MDWTNDAISNYVTFLLGTIFGVIAFFVLRWLDRRRPGKVILLKANEFSLVDINPQVRDKISIIYKSEPIISLYLTTLVLWNAGEEIIEDIKISINFNETKIIETVIDTPFLDRKCSILSRDVNNQIILTIDYLNSRKLYKDKVKIQVFATKPINIKSITGGGRNWGIEFIDRVRLLSQLSEEFIISGAVDALSVTTGWLVVAFIKNLPKFWLLGKIRNEESLYFED